jgi:predicted ABC-type ATPase
MSVGKLKVLAIAGPNGAGKSTLAPFLLRDEYGLLEFVNADAIAHGLSAFNPQSVAFEAGRVMLKRLRDLALRGESFAFETTLSSRSYAPWISGLRRQGYEFNLMFLWLRSPELAVERVRARVRAGGRDVPEGVIRRRYVKGVRNFFGLYQPLSDSWGVYDNSSRDEPRLLAQGVGKTVSRILVENVWQEFEGQTNEGGS